MAFLLHKFIFVAIGFSVVYGSKDVPQKRIEAVSGETIYLPCNVTTNEGDEVVLILWYREDRGTPIYSVDIREGVKKSVKRWSDENVFGERAYFIFDKEPGTLCIQSTTYTDSGTYRCRVDFLKAQTRNSKITVAVIDPPDKVTIWDDSGMERSTVVGPYSEGDVISLKCAAFGGIPLPQITWLRDDLKLESQLNFVPGDHFVESEITLGPLTRADLNSRITCRATNHPRASPVETVVQIDMNFSPLDIRLLGSYQSLSAGRRYDLLCQSAGSRPPAVITWWLDGIRMEKTTETTSSDGNQTTSTLSISFSKNDAGKLLTCKAYNHAVPSEPLEDGWKLDIQYVPEAYVQLGTSLDPHTIKEGSDVYFDCLVVAHPPVYRIEWRHNGLPLPRNISQGVIISNHSLVLQGVTRSTAGDYSCVGFNGEGEGTSPPFSLNILYAPTCSANQTRVYGVAKQEDAKIECSVDANPPEVEFSWTFNNSAESIDVATNHISRMGTSSTVTYTPVTELDYGTLLCMAANKIGKQRIPCVFHIIAAGRPDQVHNCTLTNISMTSLTVTCSDGFNGGMKQSFLLEMIDSNSKEIKANITSTEPRFTVATLSPGGVYTLYLYAFNSKGRSDPTVLNAAMLRMPEKQLTSEPGNKSRTDFFESPIKSLAVGLTLIIFVAALAVVLALRIPCNNRKRHQKEFCREHTPRSGSPDLSEKSSEGKEVDGNDEEKNPDVVPEIVDLDLQINCVKRTQHISTIESSRSPNKEQLVIHPSQQYSLGNASNSFRNIGYCTLRSGPQASSIVGNLSMNINPQQYGTQVSQCTLPRHQHVWSNYNSMITGTRYNHPITTVHRQSLQSTANAGQLPYFTESIVPATISPISTATLSPLARTLNQQPISHKQLPHSKVCVDIDQSGALKREPCSLSEDETNVQTPLMVKRGSAA
ncbi:sidestep VII transmembrane protein [Haematobia irritans]|uniref:sidestep VII transmembrane protein n=1 Tax=Haematobia irritans TaxID=7368 RepID=UPI003F4F887B